MKIACQSCQAKYTIADEKVLGKIVKIRCKKCSATIVINGSDSPVEEAPVSGGQAFDYASQGAAEQWTVNVADGDQRTMTTAELADAYRAGVVTDETYCWKDGMGDWLPLREIDGLHAAIAAAPQSGALAGEEGPDDQATAIQQAPPAALFAASPRPAAGAPVAAAAALPAPAPRENGGAQLAAAAARRAGPRPGPAADLFSAAATAGGEDDVMTSVPAGGIRPHDAGADKMTGQRNENSVLFSLSALTGSGPGLGGSSGSSGGPQKSSVGAATSEASGLIDIRALASNMQALQGPPKPNRVDDIMNLAGGGAFTPSLSAPILTAPPMDAPDFSAQAGGGADGVAGQPSAAAAKKKTWIIAGAAGGGVLLVAVIIVVVLFSGGDKDKDKTAADMASASASTPAGATASTAAPTTSAIAATSAPSASAPASAAPSASDDGDPSAPPIDMASVKTALKAAAATAQKCATAGGPTGTAKIVVVFKHAGTVDSATITDPTFAGTPVATCVSGKFFSAHIPKFSGPSPELAKSFTIE